MIFVEYAQLNDSQVPKSHFKAKIHYVPQLTLLFFLHFSFLGNGAINHQDIQKPWNHLKFFSQPAEVLQILSKLNNKYYTVLTIFQALF